MIRLENGRGYYCHPITIELIKDDRVDIITGDVRIKCIREIVHHMNFISNTVNVKLSLN